MNLEGDLMVITLQESIKAFPDDPFVEVMKTVLEGKIQGQK